jgi:hypothetical protein
MNAKGTGLGMSICKKIINQMGGHVYAESEIGKGTKINVEIGIKAIDKEFQVTKLESNMTNLQKIDYLKKIKALDYSMDFYQIFEIEKDFLPNLLTLEEK